MQFVVDKWKAEARRRPRTYPYSILVQDNWDDYGYKTSFQATLFLSAEASVDLGTVKILRIDQKSGLTDIEDTRFSNLGPDYCSMGADLDYYQKLRKCGKKIYEDYLKGLGDVVFDPKKKARFEDLEGFRVSLMRMSYAERVLLDGPKLFAPPDKQKSNPAEGLEFTFKTKLARRANPITVEFDFLARGGLPNRTNILIGYNGTGKTLLLSNLAVVASGYGYQDKQEFVQESAGSFVGEPPPFKTIIVVSYSAFDSFVIPGATETERRRLARDGKVLGYVYYGLRKINNSAMSKRGEYLFKDPRELEREFSRALDRVRELNRTDKLLEVLQPLFDDASFQHIGLTKLHYEGERPELIELYEGLSSGHKIVLRIIAQIASQIDEKEPSLILIDEPETHLHPPLLAAFLKSIRACLERFDAYAIVTTHSPVVLQETPSHFVHVLQRTGDRSSVRAVPIETFGENIGVITQEIFNLDDSATDWHATLADLAETSSLESIQRMFGAKLGFAPRSFVDSFRRSKGR